MDSRTASATMAVLAAFLFTGCTASPDSAETPPTAEATQSGAAAASDSSTPAPWETALADREALYAETVATFPYDFPANYSFPESLPRGNRADMAGDAAAYWWWGCSTLESAWTDVANGDIANADAKFATVIGAINAGVPGFEGWETAILDSGNLPHGPNMGTSGICKTWLASFDDE